MPTKIVATVFLFMTDQSDAVYINTSYSSEELLRELHVACQKLQYTYQEKLQRFQGSLMKGVSPIKQLSGPCNEAKEERGERGDPCILILSSHQV